MSQDSVSRVSCPGVARHYRLRNTIKVREKRVIENRTVVSWTVLHG